MIEKTKKETIDDIRNSIAFWDDRIAAYKKVLAGAKEERKNYERKLYKLQKRYSQHGD